MQILVINSGSSSIKASLFENKKGKLVELWNTLIEGINLPKSKIKNHEEGVQFLVKNLLESGIIQDLTEITTVAHRVVHGGEKYNQAVKIDNKVLKDIKELCKLAPLHNPANLQGIIATKKLLPKAKQVAVFDTAFYQTLEPKAYLYGLPLEFYKKHKIRKYGFHGTSHKYITSRLIKFSKKNSKIVSCHLGNGSSITASINGKAIETSMGFTPLEGLIMGTRCGTIDPAIPLQLQQILKKSVSEIEHILNFKSGLLGLSQTSSDLRLIYQKSLKGDKQCQLTMEILSYQIAKIIGSYAAAMNGVDSIIFTGGIGERAFYIRSNAIKYLEYLGFKMDEAKNKKAVKESQEVIEISKKNSTKKIFVIGTNEALQIANEAIAGLF
ncbi:MAG: acetate kinase [Patescibacteria group bacterium]